LKFNFLVVGPRETGGFLFSNFFDDSILTRTGRRPRARPKKLSGEAKKKTIGRENRLKNTIRKMYDNVLHYMYGAFAILLGEIN
jgi:hypothetical protein